MQIIKNLTEGLGKGIWSKAIFVLTFANELEVSHIKTVMTSWKKHLVKSVNMDAGVDTKIAESIPTVLVGYDVQQALPVDGNWLRSLWNTCFERIH